MNVNCWRFVARSQINKSGDSSRLHKNFISGNGFALCAATDTFAVCVLCVVFVVWVVRKKSDFKHKACLGVIQKLKKSTDIIKSKKVAKICLINVFYFTNSLWYTVAGFPLQFCAITKHNCEWSVFSMSDLCH